jgi:hypothetical protein
LSKPNSKPGHFRLQDCLLVFFNLWVCSIRHY